MTDISTSPENPSENISATVCRNCGCRCTSKFCPDCGQALSEKRLDNKTFFIGIASGLSCINKGFLFTAWNLLIRPWKVIRDYIQCRRIRYIAPITMLIYVCFINTFIGAFVSADSHPTVSNIGADNAPLFYRFLLSIGNFFINNTLAQNLTFYIPALLAIPIVYRNLGARKYNMAEYLSAMIYIAAACLIADTIILPINLYSESFYSTLGFCYSILICGLSMYFAFPVASKKARIGYFALYLLTAALVYIVIITALATLIGIGRLPT